MNLRFDRLFLFSFLTFSFILKNSAIYKRGGTKKKNGTSYNCILYLKLIIYLYSTQASKPIQSKKTIDQKFTRTTDRIRQNGSY